MKKNWSLFFFFFFAFPSFICESSHILHLPTPETHTHRFNMQSKQISGEGATKINMAGVSVHSQWVLISLLFLVVGSFMMCWFYTLQLYIDSYSTLLFVQKLIGVLIPCLVCLHASGSVCSHRILVCFNFMTNYTCLKGSLFLSTFQCDYCLQYGTICIHALLNLPCV